MHQKSEIGRSDMCTNKPFVEGHLEPTGLDLIVAKKWDFAKCDDDDSVAVKDSYWG